MKKINTTWIIDDDPIQVFLAKRILTNLGFTQNIRTMDNAEKAIKELHGLNPKDVTFPNIIFVDINMPQMDGWQFLKELDKMNLAEDSDLYLVTSSINPDDVEKAKSYENLSGYLIKPIKIDDLVEIQKKYTIKEFKAQRS